MSSIAALNVGAVNDEPTNLMESVQVMKDGTEMFANGLIAMMKFLDKAADIMPLLGVEPQGIDMWNEIKCDGGLSFFVELSIVDSAQPSHKAAEYAVISEHNLETVNKFFLCFKSLEDVNETLQTHNVTGRLEELSVRCNKAKDAICPSTSEFH